MQEKKKTQVFYFEVTKRIFFDTWTQDKSTYFPAAE
jgi:hypothetical protein